jgi:hypothetical protein
VGFVTRHAAARIQFARPQVIGSHDTGVRAFGRA